MLSFKNELLDFLNSKLQSELPIEEQSPEGQEEPEGQEQGQEEKSSDEVEDSSNSQINQEQSDEQDPNSENQSQGEESTEAISEDYNTEQGLTNQEQTDEQDSNSENQSQGEKSTEAISEDYNTEQGLTSNSDYTDNPSQGENSTSPSNNNSQPPSEGGGVTEVTLEPYDLSADENDNPLEFKDFMEIKSLLDGDLEGDIDDGLLDNTTYEEFKKLMADMGTSNLLENLTNDYTLEVQPTKKVTIRWWNDLVKLFKTLKPTDTSFKRLNKKLQYMDIKLPSKSGMRKQSGDIEECHIYLDVSGSMTKQDLDVAMSTVKVSRKYFKGSTTKFFSFADNLNQHPVKYLFTHKIKPGGGTDIKNCLENIYKLNKKKNTLNIIISDGGFDWNLVNKYAKLLKNTYMVFLVTSDSKFTVSEISRANLLDSKNKYVKIYFAIETGMVDWVVSSKLKKEVDKLYG